MFELKRPCKDCPFVKGSSTNRSLEEGRIDRIIDSLHEDHIFSCHKTIDYGTLEEFEDRLQPQNKFCAGALNYLKKEGKPNQPMQIAERLGFFHPEELKGQEQIIDIIPMPMPWERKREKASNLFSDNI
ncbi:hypothetical protein [Viridibacillus arvi]|uniref:hypothetical protein n=1 Tax=Viridibacillus arvi TaxID=263475 RepID=UPI0034CF631B